MTQCEADSKLEVSDQKSPRNFLHRVFPCLARLPPEAATVIACFLNHIFAFGPFYAFGTFLPALKDDLGLSVGEASTVYSCMTAAVFMGSLFAGLLIPGRASHRVVAAMSGLIATAGFTCFSFAPNWILACACAIFSGLGLGGSNLAALTALNVSVRPGHRALFVGIATCGTGIGTVLLPQFYHQLIDSMEWRWAMRVNGFTSGAVLLLISPVFKVPSAGQQQKQQLKTTPQPVQAKEEKDSARRVDPRFVCWWLNMLVCFAGWFGPATLFAQFANEELGIDSASAASANSLIGVGAFITRLFLGYITSFCGGARRTHLMSQVASGVMAVLFPFCWNLTSLTVWSLLYGFCIGPTIALVSVVLSELFGTHVLPLYHGCSRTGVGIGAFLGPPLIGKLVEVGGFRLGLVTAGGLVICSAGFLIILAVLQSRIQKQLEELPSKESGPSLENVCVGEECRSATQDTYDLKPAENSIGKRSLSL
eukprot:TRINITY_DN25264_c0_g1_i1.p1 TRINITY_DN25264_c0_g1~~TRINITY_DN25264_c0_g1_i1.p1  ORF type:complete len:495 (-),score=34.07 TRINITY_DN25264_c0_g1_i1:133-1572(-)